MVRPSQPAILFRFGATTVNPGRRELSHDGVCVSVGDRAFDLLMLLIEQRGTVVNHGGGLAAKNRRREHA